MGAFAVKRLSIISGTRRVVVAALFVFAFPAIAFAQSAEQPVPKPPPSPDVAQNCPGLVARIGRAPFRPPSSLPRSRRPGPHHLCRPFDVPDREPAARAHRHRLQRLCPPAGAARHRHHEPRAHDPLHRSARSGDQARAARLGAEPDKPARHDIQFEDVRVRNVPTNIRDWMAAAPSGTAIRSSSSRSPICASPISAICITR